MTSKSVKFENLKPVFFFALVCERTFIKTHSIESRCVIGMERTFIKTHSIESRCVIGMENKLFAAASVHLSARNFYRGAVKGLIVTVKECVSERIVLCF